jgi:hypothetical protein
LSATESDGRPAQEPGTGPGLQRSGALDRHPRYAEAVAEYEAWLTSLLPADRGTPGQRNWRLRCVAKACEILSARTGRTTGNAVLRMIGFGSSTDVSVDVRDWIEREAPRKADMLQISPLLKSEALRDAVNSALMQILGSAQQEARTAASEELQGERATLEAERIQSQLEVSRALAARDAAMDTAAAMERERDQHAQARQQAEAMTAQLRGQLTASEQSLAAAATRERELKAEIERVRSETDKAIDRLKLIADQYATEIDRLQGDQRRLLGQVEEARADARQIRTDLQVRVGEVAGLSQRNAVLSTQAVRDGALAAAAQARVFQLEQVSEEQRTALAASAQSLADVQAELAIERSQRQARENLAQAVQSEALRCAAIQAMLRARGAVLVVDGDRLPRLELQVDGAPITPRFDSLSQLEAHCDAVPKDQRRKRS